MITSTPVNPQAESFVLPSGPIGIVILHGYGGSIADYRSVGQMLQAKGYTVIGHRLPGHGQDQAALRAVTVADCQQSVDEVFNDWKAKVDHLFILGSSFGGVLALDAAIRHPTVSGLILVNTAMSYSGGGTFQGILLRLLRLFRPDYPKKGLSAQERAYAASIGSSTAWPINGILATAAFARREVTPKLSMVTSPSLILHSVHDPVVGPENSRRLSNQLGGNLKELTEIPVKSHRPFRDIDATTFIAEHTSHFIQRVVA